MSNTMLSDDLARRLAELRASGHTVFGPGPTTPGETTPTPDQKISGAGMHVQISGTRGRLIEGFGGTADEAVLDALAKLER